MSKKKRFRKKTLGRLAMFFKITPYTGYLNNSKYLATSNVYIFLNFLPTSLYHYNYVTKKKINNPYN